MKNRNDYVYDNKRTRSLADWVRKIAEDIYGQHPDNRAFLKDYHLIGPLQDVVNNLVNDIITRDNLTQEIINDTNRPPSSAAVKAADDAIVDYINNQISALPQPMQYIGSWDVSTNTPELVLPDNTKGGFTYTVIGSGNRFGITWTAGDVLIIDNEGNAQKWDVHDASIGNKLDKQTNATPLDQAYVKSASGSQTMVNLNMTNVPFTIPLRTSDGRIRVSNAIDTNDAIALGQADSKYAVKSVESTKQDVLISGENIKTIGLQSILGPGNISIPSTAEFASKQELSEYISSKNEPNIDLKGKTHLGGGVYLLTSQNGMDLTFNARNGELRLFGTATGQLTYSLGTRPTGDYYMQIWKTKQVSFTTGAIIYGGGGGDMQVSIWPTASYEGKKPLYTAQYIIGTWNISGPIDVYFKVQLEKGTTRTPYAVPAGNIPYIPEVKTEFDTKLDKASNTTSVKQAYVKLEDGTNTMMGIADSSPQAYTLARRYDNGRIVVGNAINANEAVALGQLDWKLITTNSSNTGTTIDIPSGYKEILITANGHSTVHLPNIEHVEAVSIRADGANYIQTGATWRIGFNSLIKSWGTGVTTTVVSYRIYGR